MAAAATSGVTTTETPGQEHMATTEPRPAAVFAALAAFFSIWTACLSIVNAPFPILHDMSEAYVWGREFQFGYNQHPPFWAWLCGAWFLVFPRTVWAFAALGALNATVGLGGAWTLIGDFARGPTRVAAFSLLLLTPFYTFGCYKYDANTIFLSIWPWTLHFFVASLRDPRPSAAIGFGVCAGLALMSKYYALILIATCLLGAQASPLRSKYFASGAPYVSAAIAAAIFAPHLIWLVAHEAPPLRYLLHISGRGFGDVTGDAAWTAFGSLLSNLPALAIIAWFARPDLARLRSSLDNARSDPSFRTLAIFALAPLVLTLLAGLALRTKLTPEMTIATFSLVPLLAIEVCGARNVESLSRWSARLAAAFLALMFAASPLIMLGRAYLWRHADDVAPYQELAVEATKLWRARTSTPVGYVAGKGYEDPIVFYSPDRAHAFYGFDYSKNLWVTPERLAALGLMTVCRKDDGECLARTAGFLDSRSIQTEIDVAHRFWRHVAKTYAFIVTIVPPRDCSESLNATSADCAKPPG